MNNDVDEYKNTFNSNIENNLAAHKRRPTPIINQFPERGTLSVSEQSKNLIRGYTKHINFVLVGKHMY